MSLYFSDESKAPRECPCCTNGQLGEFGDKRRSRCPACNGAGRINDGARPDIEVECQSDGYRWRVTPGNEGAFGGRLRWIGNGRGNGFGSRDAAIAAARAALKGGK